MLKGMHDLPISILSVEENTYDTALKMDSIHPMISRNTPGKIFMALNLFEKYVNINELK